MRTKKELKKIGNKLAKVLEEDIMNRYYGWEYFDPDIIDEVLRGYHLTKSEEEIVLRPLKNLF